MTKRTGFITLVVPLVLAVTSPTISAQTGSDHLPPGHPRIGPLRQALHTPDSTAAWLGQFAGRAEQGESGVTEQQGSAVGSVLGAGLGMAAGTAGALLIASASGGDFFDQLAVAGLSLLILEPVGVGVGAHLGNGGHGRAGSAIGASFASFLLGNLALSAVAGDEEISPVFSFAVLGLQIGSAVTAERRSARNRER